VARQVRHHGLAGRPAGRRLTGFTRCGWVLLVATGWLLLGANRESRPPAKVGHPERCDSDSEAQANGRQAAAFDAWLPGRGRGES
jgi:hypothetical protein